MSIDGSWFAPGGSVFDPTVRPGGSTPALVSPTVVSATLFMPPTVTVPAVMTAMVG